MYSCYTADSIRLMAEAACIPEPPSLEVAATISEDVTYRLRQIISRAIKFMRHSNRTKLTCADINKALRWSDCQPVFGYEPEANQAPPRFSYSAGAHVFRYENESVDLVQRYKEQPRADALLNKETCQQALPQLSIDDIN